MYIYIFMYVYIYTCIYILQCHKAWLAGWIFPGQALNIMADWVAQVCYTPIPVGQVYGDWLGPSASSIWLRASKLETLDVPGFGEISRRILLNHEKWRLKQQRWRFNNLTSFNPPRMGFDQHHMGSRALLFGFRLTQNLWSQGSMWIICSSFPSRLI